MATHDSITPSSIILHNYPQSPVAEKVRVSLGIKKLPWYNVEIPRLPPKPMLTELTGGYRRTPVMQIGADIYCDSQCILLALEAHTPSPTFYPGPHSGTTWCASRWADGALFDLSVKIVLGSAGEDLPKDFAEDRGRLYLGADWAEGLKQANKELPHLVAQLRTAFSGLNAQLSEQQPFLTGSEVSEFDAQMYHVVWFVRGRWSEGPAMLSEFPQLQRWEQRIQQLGHGTPTDMDPEEAIKTASNSQSITSTGVAENDPQGLKVGDTVTVMTAVDGGEQPVAGTVRMANANTIAIDRESEKAGAVCVHFPRYGYQIVVG